MILTGRARRSRFVFLFLLGLQRVRVEESSSMSAQASSLETYTDERAKKENKRTAVEFRVILFIKKSRQSCVLLYFYEVSACKVLLFRALEYATTAPLP